MRKRAVFIFMILSLVLMQVCTAAFAEDEDLIYWGEVKTGVYDLKFPAYNDNYKQTGYDLQKQKMTKVAEDVDFIFTTSFLSQTWLVRMPSDQIGGKVVYDQELTDPVKRITQVYAELKTFIKDEVEPGDMMLILTSDETFAKIRIDKITPSKMTFSYVLETDGPQEQPGSEQPALTPPDEQPPMNDPESGQPSEPSSDPLNDPLNDPLTNPQDESQNEMPAADDAPASKIILTISSTTAIVNGEPYALDVSPEVINNTTMVPLRFIAEALGAEVGWNQRERKITIALVEDSIVLWVGEQEAMVNGEQIWLNTPPQIIDDTTMVPLRFVSESLHQKVQYEVSSKRITITPREA